MIVATAMAVAIVATLPLASGPFAPSDGRRALSVASRCRGSKRRAIAAVPIGASIAHGLGMFVPLAFPLAGALVWLVAVFVDAPAAC